MKRVLVAVGLGTVGVLFALGLTVGALAVAGPDVGAPPTVPVLDTAPEPSPTPTAKVANHDNDDGRPSGKDDDRASPKPTDSPSSTPATDDRSGPSGDGGTGDDSGSEDHESHSGSEDHEEPDDD